VSGELFFLIIKDILK